jgi:hypothetical protein
MLAASAAVMGRAVPVWVYATSGVVLPNSCLVLLGEFGWDAPVLFVVLAYGDLEPLTRSGDRGKSGVPGEFGNLKVSIMS